MTRKHLTIGVLALQGSFAKHCDMLKSLDAKPIEVRTPEQLHLCDALILPGGETTTMLLQMQRMHFPEALKAFADTKPIFGTCAGSILMAKKEAAHSITPFGFMDITVERNAYGRQLDSFRTELNVSLHARKTTPYLATFIRAPIIRHFDPTVTVLATYNNSPVLIQQGRHLCATFHPELTDDPSIHHYFINNLVATNKA